MSAVIASLLQDDRPAPRPRPPVVFVQLRSDKAVADLVKQYVPLAHKVAWRFARYARMLEAVDYDDLFVAAQVGVWKAARTWEERRCTFVTYAYNTARWSVSNLLRDMELLDLRVAKALIDAGEPVPRLISMSAPIREHEHGATTVEDAVSALLAADDGGAQEHAETMAHLEHVADTVLPRRDKVILWQFYQSDRMMADIADEHGLSRQRVHQIIHSSVAILRNALEATMSPTDMRSEER